MLISLTNSLSCHFAPLLACFWSSARESTTKEIHPRFPCTEVIALESCLFSSRRVCKTTKADDKLLSVRSRRSWSDYNKGFTVPPHPHHQLVALFLSLFLTPLPSLAHHHHIVIIHPCVMGIPGI